MEHYHHLLLLLPHCYCCYDLEDSLGRGGKCWRNCKHFPWSWCCSNCCHYCWRRKCYYCCWGWVWPGCWLRGPRCDSIGDETGKKSYSGEGLLPPCRATWGENRPSSGQNLARKWSGNGKIAGEWQPPRLEGASSTWIRDRHEDPAKNRVEKAVEFRANINLFGLDIHLLNWGREVYEKKTW